MIVAIRFREHYTARKLVFCELISVANDTADLRKPIQAKRRHAVKNFEHFAFGIEAVTHPSVMETLRTSHFFTDCSDDDLKRLAEICHVEEFSARTTVFEEYEPARVVYVIVSGEISLAICEPKVSCRQIAVVRAGDLMGWSALVGRARLYDTARTQTPVKALAFDGDELMKFCAANPSFGFQFMHRVACTLAERLGGTRLQLLDMCGIHLPKFTIETD